MLVWLVASLILITQSFGSKVASADTSGDGYVTYDSITKTWTIGTASVEKKLQLNASGQYLLTSFKNKLTGKEYIQGS